MTTAFVIGNETIDVNVSVENLEPDGAFEATVTALLPPGIRYAKVYNIQAVSISWEKKNLRNQTKITYLFFFFLFLRCQFPFLLLL